MKKTVFACIILHIAEWIVFLLCDYYEEHSDANDLAVTVGMLVLPVISAAVLGAFFALLRKHTAFQKKWQYSLVLAGVWFVLCGIAFLAELCVIEHDCFPIRQQTGGWEHFLNGIEYIFFPAFNLVVGCSTMLILTLIIVLTNYFRRKKERVS
ncbi:MAG: hypothetical protein IKI58_07010 [Oscillospiraceae bacterium]|nr:hypothetical protein [Oscillospiraceae bacterium]